MVVAIAIAAGVTAIASLRAGNSAPATTEPLTVEKKSQEKNKPDLGRKLEINDEPREIDEPVDKPKIRKKPVRRRRRRLPRGARDHDVADLR